MPGFSVTIQVLVPGVETPEEAARSLIERIRRPGGVADLKIFVGSGPPTRSDHHTILLKDD